MVDASAIGVGIVYVHVEDKGQMQDIYYNSRIFTESDQKNAMIYRELTAIVYALEVY